MNITSCFKFMTPFCHVLPVHNIFAINRNKMMMNFSSGFSFRMKKSNYCTNLTFGRILNRHSHFKHTLRAQRYCDCGPWTQPCHTVPISHGSTAISEKENPLHFYFPDIPHASSKKVSRRRDCAKRMEWHCTMPPQTSQVIQYAMKLAIWLMRKFRGSYVMYIS
jgi:hypothetical protein